MCAAGAGTAVRARVDTAARPLSGTVSYHCGLRLTRRTDNRGNGDPWVAKWQKNRRRPLCALRPDQLATDWDMKRWEL